MKYVSCTSNRITFGARAMNVNGAETNILE